MRDFIQDGNVFRVHPAPLSPPPPAPPPPAPPHSSSTLLDSQHNSSSAEFLNFVGRRNNHITNDSTASSAINNKQHHRHHHSRSRISAATICQRSCSYLDQIFDNSETINNRDLPDSDGLSPGRSNNNISMLSSAIPAKRITTSRSERQKSCMLWIVTPLLARFEFILQFFLQLFVT